MRLGNWKFFEKRIITDDQPGPLVTRRILFRCPWFGLFLHTLHRSDYDRALHDHPWGFISIILKNGYSEMTPKGVLTHFAGSVLFRPAEWKHCVIIDDPEYPSWNLVFVGPRTRKWGF